MDARYYETYGRLQDRHWWFRARGRILATLIEAWALAPPGGHILDLGCGTGGPLHRLLAGRYRLVGIDSEPAAVEAARRAGYGGVRLGTVDAPGVAEGSQDLAMLLDVIEHVEDDVALLRGAARLVRAGGCLLVTVPAHAWLWSGHDELAHHRRRYSRRLLRERLGQAGLVCERLTFFNTWLFPLAAVKKVLDKVRAPSGELGYYDAPGKRLNGWFEKVFASEAAWLKRRTFPTGVSLLVVARKGQPCAS